MKKQKKIIYEDWFRHYYKSRCDIGRYQSTEKASQREIRVCVYKKKGREWQKKIFFFGFRSCIIQNRWNIPTLYFRIRLEFFKKSVFPYPIFIHTLGMITVTPPLWITKIVVVWALNFSSSFCPAFSLFNYLSIYLFWWW